MASACGIGRFSPSDNPSEANSEKTAWFPKPEPENLLKQKGGYFIPDVHAYQQTTEYTCGPAALMAIAIYYRMENMSPDSVTEMRIAREMGTRSMAVLKDGGKPGTTPHEMLSWLRSHGFDANVEYEDANDGSALHKLRENVMNGIPTIVEWADLGGHWAVVVGYDTRNNHDPWDDVLILADSYDRFDDHPDGYSFVNANRFYWLWYDAFCFDKLTWRTMITAVRQR